jgi:hypothetical protein
MGTTELSGSFLVVNSGETKAVLQCHYSEIIVTPVLPAMTTSQNVGDQVADVELPPGQSVRVSFPTGGAKTLGFPEFSAIGNRLEYIKKQRRDTGTDFDNLFVVGWIKYLDEGRVLRTVGFCKKYNFVTERFEREADEFYEYGDHGETSDSP